MVRMLASSHLLAAREHLDKSHWGGISGTIEYPFAVHSSTMNTYAGNGLPVGGGPPLAATSTDLAHACVPSIATLGLVIAITTKNDA
jgi:hypothetical protein